MALFRTIITVFIIQISLFSLSIEAKVYDKPKFLISSPIVHYYDGLNDDLLTAGWSNKQLELRKLPERNGESEVAWIRKAAYYNNIIALLDTTVEGGFGRLFGPKAGHSPVAGFEYLSASLDNKSQIAASFSLQIPDDMDLKNKCLIVAASSGSRGVYGAVGTVGFWALEHHCAVVYTDKGTGTGFYFFDDQKGYSIDGKYTKGDSKHPLIFRPEGRANLAFVANHPSAVSIKHAYSKTNVEKDFGLYVMQAAQYAMYQLNQHFAKQSLSFKSENTMIIAASISNGGVSSVKVGEIDTQNLFDGIVASEPNIYPQPYPKLSIFQGKNKIALHSMPGYDYFIIQNLYSPCALLTKQALTMPFAIPMNRDNDSRLSWCRQLKEDGLIEGDTIEQMASNSLKKITQLGIMENHQTLAPLMQVINIWPALAVTYTNQFGRYDLSDHICSQYYSATDQKKNPIELKENQRRLLFATSNGIPPTGGIYLVSSDTKMSDYQQAICFYRHSKSNRVRKGVNQVVSNSFYSNKPMIIIHGRSDNLVAPNHTSRPYYAFLERKSRKLKNDRGHWKSNARYYEVTNAQHFDAFTALPQYADQYIPLHYYFDQSLDLMFEHLSNGQPLPPSQVVETITRKKSDTNTLPLEQVNLPKIDQVPNKAIKWVKEKGNQEKLYIPE